MVTDSSPDLPIEALESLAEALDELRMPESWDAERERTIRTIRSYLIPRLETPNHPLTVVFAGPTGSGKSTLINSIAATELSATGPLRPTTRRPVVFAAGIWAGAEEDIAGVPCDVVAGDAPILKELTLVDTPDIDSTSTEHRAMAEAFIDVADVVVFVSSALRYADRVPWEVLRRARARGAPVVPVLNRARPGSRGAVSDFRRLLEAEGLPGKVVAIAEHHLAGDAYSIPSGSVRDLRKRLVAQIEVHRMANLNTWRRVLASVCATASELIEAGALYERELSDFRAMVGEETSAPSRRLLDDYPKGNFGPAVEMSEAGEPGRRLARALRRSIVGSPGLGVEQRRFAEAVMVSMERTLVAGSMTLGRPIDDAEYTLIRGGVLRWLGKPLDGIPARSKANRAINELLVRIGAVTIDSWPARLLEGLGYKPDPEFEQRLVADLSMEVEAAFAMASGRSMAAFPASSTGALETARFSLGTVIARFSFSDA